MLARLLPLLLLFGLPVLGVAQLSTPYFPGAAAQAMGGTGVVSTGPRALFVNPAGLGRTEVSAVEIGAYQPFGVSELTHLNAAGVLATGAGSFGLTVNYFGFDLYNEQRIGLAYGRRLAERFYLGAQLNYLGLDLAEYGSRGLVSFELGIQSDISQTVRLGAALRNPVRQSLNEDVQLPSVLVIGLDYEPSTKAQLLLEVEKDIDRPIRLRTGLEYRFLEALALRIGLRTAPAEPTFGLGIRAGERLRIDAAGAVHPNLGWSSGVSVRYELGER